MSICSHELNDDTPEDPRETAFEKERRLEIALVSIVNVFRQELTSAQILGVLDLVKTTTTLSSMDVGAYILRDSDGERNGGH